MVTVRRAAPNRAAANGSAANGRGAETPTLAALGLVLGEEIRFRRLDRTRWQSGVVAQMERDGSIGITDANGAARSLALENISVRLRPRRYGAVPPTGWEPLADRTARAEQLTLL